VSLRGLKPDYGVKREPEEDHDEMAGFRGEATVALPRVFDWLHWVGFNAGRGSVGPGIDRRKGRRAIYVLTRAPEAWIRNYAANTGSLTYARVPHATS
jgi:hypothetical protein